MNQAISLNRIIGDVIGNLGLTNVNNVKDDFARWSSEGLALIGSKNTAQKYECELTIKNKKAALPPNFLHVLAVKKGDKFLQTTDRSFVQWNKAVDINTSTTVDANCDLPEVIGVPRSENILFGGSFSASSVVVITITLNNNGSVTNKVFSYIVQIGDTINDIIDYFLTSINTTNIGLTAVLTNGGINVTSNSVDVNFTITPYTDDAIGTVSVLLIQKQIANRKATKQTTTSSGINTKSGNLADVTVNTLNTGHNRQGSITAFDDVYKIENGCIWFNSFDGERIGISYMGVALDEEGWPLVDERHERAVTAYLMYMYKAREFYSGKLQNYVFQELKLNWLRLCSQSRGDDELPDRMEMQYLTNMWNQLLPLYNKELF